MIKQRNMVMQVILMIITLGYLRHLLVLCHLQRDGRVQASGWQPWFMDCTLSHPFCQFIC